MSRSLSRSLLINTLWSFIGRFGYLAVGLASNIALARMLSPTEFGQIAIMMFFIVLATVLIESGLSGALVRKQDATEDDYSTIFVFNLVVSLVLMIGLIASSGYIADFYNDEGLAGILIAASFVLLINALRITQAVRLVKELKFKVKAGCEFVAILMASTIAIFLANRGAGVWALVSLQLSTSVFLTGLLWFVVGPIKSYKFSKKSFLQFYRFGVNTTLASLLNSAFDNIYQLVLAKYFSIQHSGYFYQAKKLQEMPAGILQTAMLGVVYSTLSRLQGAPEEFNALYQNATKVFTIIIAIISMVIFCYAGFIVDLLYGEKWSGSVLYLQLLTVASFFYLQEMFNRVIFKIFDRTELILRLELFKKATQSGTIVYGIWVMSVEALLYGFVVISFISFLVNYYFARKVQGCFYWKDFFVVIKVLFSTVTVVALSEFFVSRYDLSELEALWILPVMLASFVFLLHCLRAIDFSNDVKRFTSLCRGN